MKLERLHESVLATVVLVGGLSLAIFCGSLAGSGNIGLLGAVLAGITATAGMVALRHRAWMLIPILWLLPGKISFLPLPFTVRQIGIIFAVVTFLALKALKVIRLKPKMGILDLWMVVNLVYLLTVFLRNPVGVEAVGSWRVGGRPYFDVLVACAGYWVLSRAVASRRDAFFLPLLMVAASVGDLFLNIIARRFPSTAGFLTQLYSGVSALDTPDGEPVVPGEGSTRLAYMSGFGTMSSQAAFSYWRPFTVLNPFNPFRFLVFAAASYAILSSGFRSVIVSMVVTFLLGSYFRQGMIEVIRASVIGVLLLGIVLVAQGTVIDLPQPAQRALSFLPGNWDYSARMEAQGSTEWRMQMWRAMLTENRYIENKWLGDGFGFTHRQLDIMNANMLHGTTADQQENLLISGGVHSGPVSAIRYVGFVGLALFVIFTVMVARGAFRLIRRCEKTPFFPLALFIGIPAVWFPLNYLLVFGAYNDDLPGTIIMVGLLKMLENSLDADAALQKSSAAPVERPQRTARRPRYAPLAPVR